MKLRNAVVGMFGLLTLATGCASPATSWCEQSADCGRLNGRTVSQCKEDENRQVATWYDRKECVALAERYEALARCATSVSCEAYSKEVSIDTNAKCKAELSDYLAARASYNKQCGDIAPH